MLLPADTRIKLLFAPYRAPQVKYGDTVQCSIRGTVRVVGWKEDGLIVWPLGRPARQAGHASLILFGDLERAIRTESELAVAHHWKISITTIWKFRRALGVGRITDGTAKLYSEYAPAKVASELSRVKSNFTNRTAERRQHMSEKKTGRPMHPATKAALFRAVSRPKSEDWKRQARERGIASGRFPVNPKLRPWTAEEERMLGTKSDREIAAMLGRTIPMIRGRRKKLGIKSFSPLDVYHLCTNLRKTR